MELPEEQKDLLRARYEVWGLDAVRAELARNELDPLAPPAIVAFAREWVAAEDAKLAATMRSMKKLAIVVAVMVFGAFAAVVVT